MKKMKKIASIVLALALVVSIFVPTFVIGATNDTTENDIVENENDIIEGESITDDTHICTITKANATRHIVDCECGEYERVRHNELEKVAVNGFFHIQSCECGYASTEEHEFDTAFNAMYHYDVCVDCGYSAPAEEHTLCDVFDGNEHYIECDSCGYMAERHIGVDYATASKELCYAVCSCDTVELVEHEWDGFECENCHYEMSGKTTGIIERIWYSEEGNTVRIDVNGTNHIIDLDDATFEEGDCVIVEHYGNDIWDVRVMVEYELCDDPENIPVYVAESVLAEMAYENYNSNTISDIEVYDDGTAIIEFYDGSFLYVENAVIYDFEGGEIVDIDWICEDERILWFFVGNELVILDYYY